MILHNFVKNTLPNVDVSFLHCLGFIRYINLPYLLQEDFRVKNISSSYCDEVPEAKLGKSSLGIASRVESSPFQESNSCSQMSWSEEVDSFSIADRSRLFF